MHCWLIGIASTLMYCWSSNHLSLVSSWQLARYEMFYHHCAQYDIINITLLTYIIIYTNNMGSEKDVATFKAHSTQGVHLPMWQHTEGNNHTNDILHLQVADRLER